MYMEFQLKFLRQGINLNLGQDVTHSQDRPGPGEQWVAAGLRDCPSHTKR